MADYTPLRYPGGKGKFTPYVKEVMELNGLVGGHYVEPFAGGAGVAFGLLFSEYAKRIHINDLDPSVYAFWYSVLNHPEDLCRLIKDTRVNIKNWLKQRDIKRDPENASTLELGFATFYLNRTNRSGILNGGVIGGLEQTGAWKIDARYNKKGLIERIEKIALFSKRVSLYNLDACTFLEKKVPTLPKQTLVYLDPPYYEKGQRLYQNHFVHEDHVRLAKSISKIKDQKWIVSYDNFPQIKDLYKRFRQEEFSLSYSARNYYLGAEVMIFQNGLVKPDQIYTSQKRRA